MDGCVRLSSWARIGPDLTGRENIFLNGSILGMTYREISRKIASIIEFAEIEEFIDVPVKKYSSGMFVRLGFSIAVHLDADIMLFDEVLAVGDFAFQARCFERVKELREAGKTIVLVSHDLAAIERICDRALLLRSGEVAMIGEPRAVVENYQTLGYSALARSAQHDNKSKRVTCRTLTFRGLGGGPIRTGEPLLLPWLRGTGGTDRSACNRVLQLAEWISLHSVIVI